MTPVLEVRDGAVGYGSVSLVRDLNLAVEAGKFICLLGPNGAGKTTLLRALAGLGALLSGDVLLDGAPCAGVRGRPSRRESPLS